MKLGRNVVVDTWYTGSPRETRDVASSLVDRWGNDTCVGLIGQLGSGKTTFVKGLIEGLGGEKNNVRSPTFTLVQRYEELTPTVVHADLYRSETKEEQETIGFLDYACDSLLLVEWADKWIYDWPDGTLSLVLEHEGPSTRSLRLLEVPPSELDVNLTIPLVN